MRRVFLITNNKEPERVCQVYTLDTEWRKCDQFINGREEVWPDAKEIRFYQQYSKSGGR
ncbi:DUF1348 family protein [Pedobacter cryoconitis]|uniref:DUF1348 family protein n=1 Tax=Pedobacter cryoconitis TaxID=188932 RepID=UPI001FEC6AC2|nr:DUF1348 family protein [Pedobacter cryoconitis]